MKSSLRGLAALLVLSALPLSVQAQSGAPMHGGSPMTVAEAMKQAPKLDADLVPLDKALTVAATNLKKHPKDAKVKKAYVDAAYNYGHALMTLPQGKVSPRVQYRAALGYYRMALAVDPKHQASLSEKKTIDDIYRSMPGGIPK